MLAVVWTAAGQGWLHFSYDPRFWGVVLWGRATADEIAKLCGSLARELEDTAVPHVSLVDARRVEAADPGAFAALQSYVEARVAELAVKVERLAIIRPPGMAGALVAGFFEVLPRPYPVEIHTSLEDGLRWLGRSEALDAVEQAHSSVASVPETLARLRAYLDANLETAITLPVAAKALATSERTLQRRLGEARTTLSDEISLARVRVAKRLMVDTDASLTAIAHTVGCASLQHLGQLFRRLEGKSPTVWRADARASKKE